MSDKDLAARVAELEASLAEVTARLHEVDHRIKNDLQLMASVFILQIRRLPEGPVREAIRGALDRLSAVSAVHRRLDCDADPKRLEVSELVRDLVGEIAGGARRKDVQVTLDLEPVVLPSRQAAPLALIVNELVRNALVHAFPNGPGVLSVSVHTQAGRVELTVEDDGVGLPPGQAAPQGFGTVLAGLLSQQLKGELQIGAAQRGVRAVVRFPEAC